MIKGYLHKNLLPIGGILCAWLIAYSSRGRIGSAIGRLCTALKNPDAAWSRTEATLHPDKLNRFATQILYSKILSFAFNIVAAVAVPFS
jgi:hypothetical protein